ncbi:ABC transporter ATP-binding protein [Undibacterium arcticum]|uniref:ABC transporter ATP-binding protein n=1 Tax=Undibacterium arcticum TaxID=1762892 RepID=A0ABV7EX48_9BURK
MLSVKKLEAFYGDFQALFGIDFEIGESETVSIIGSNGAGKSTFLKTVCGQLKAAPSAIIFAGEPIGGKPANEIVAKGIAMVPEGRRLFRSLTVEENLLMGGFAKRSGPWNLKRVYQLFPALEEKRNNLSTALSGGQQQMVAIGRALMANPKILICDEVSLGLAPIVVKGIYDALPKITSDGLAVIIVEQDIDTAMRVSDRVYCFMHGRVSLKGRSADLTKNQISDAYFGI